MIESKIVDWFLDGLILYVKTKEQDFHFADEDEVEVMKKRGVHCVNNHQVIKTFQIGGNS